MIRIAFFADILSKDFDGASRTMYQLISRIDKEKYDFIYITGQNRLAEETDLKIYQTPSLPIPFQKRYKMSFLIWKNRRIQAILADFQPDVIHISTPSFLGSWALKYANNHRIPVISIFHTYFSSYMQYYFRRIPFMVKILRKVSDNIQKKFYNKCSIIYVPSNSMNKELSSIGVDKSKIKLWERGIDHQLFSPAHRDLPHIHRITNNEKKNILFVSRLVWEKNLNALIDLYQLLQRGNLDYNLIIVGTGHAEKTLRKIMPYALFCGSMEHRELSKLYASADVLFFPSISETFGNVVLEALASGLPAIVADKGGTQDMIEDGFNGFVCPHNRTDIFLSKIVLLLEDKTILSKMKVNARASSLGYNWDHLAGKYFNDIVLLATSNKDKYP